MQELFGVVPLDRVLAPVPEHSLMLVLDETGRHGTRFLTQAVGQRLRSGGHSLYVSIDQAPHDVLTQLQAMNPLPSEALQRFQVIDAHSGVGGNPEESYCLIRDPSNPHALVETLQQTTHQRPHDLLVVDSLTGLLARSGSRRLEATLPELRQAARRFQSSIFLHTPRPGENLQWLAEGFDAVVGIHEDQNQLAAEPQVLLERADWRHDVRGRRHRFGFSQPGGLQLHIPKIVVTGPVGSGKTTFLHAASHNAASVERMGTTVTLDRGVYDSFGVRAGLWGTPGQGRFDALMGMILEGASGLIVLADATRPETLRRVSQLMERGRRARLPTIIAANKQDRENALTPEILAQRIPNRDGVPIIGCHATDPRSARTVVQFLIDRILSRGEET